ncbi:MAG TPA: SCO family protein [Candidatus Angelobacter sp.]|nr:SCO family protein [Candidatus Angelobacter sp.]
MRSKNLASIAAIAVLFFMAAVLAVVGPTRATALDNSHWGANYFPNITLTTQDGRTVHFYDDLIKGKIVVIDLIYTHCVYSCPLETARLVQVQKMLGDRVGKDIFFYSITIDPEHDTPEQLKQYAESYHTGPGWLFLTGKKEDIDLLSKKLGLYSPLSTRNRDGHVPAVLLGNESTGQWMRNSATDNPRFLATLIGNWLNSWKNNQAQTQKSYAEAAPLNIDSKGRYIFATHCAACHTIGHGDKIGPDLAGVTRIRERGWLEQFITTPDKMIAGNDPIAVELFNKYKKVNMPNLRLAQVDVNALIDYMAAPVATEKGASATAQSAEKEATLPNRQ